MATKTTKYSPDTCDCVIEYTWDDSVPADIRTHTLSTYINKCSAHSGLATDQDRWNSIFEENPRKGQALQLVLKLPNKVKKHNFISLTLAWFPKLNVSMIVRRDGTTIYKKA